MTEQEHPLDFLAELALGVLVEAEAPGIREHLAGCDSCRAEYEVMIEAARVLPYAVSEVEPGPAVREGLMERIASEPRVLRPRAAVPPWRRFASIAAAAAVLVAAGGFAGAVLFSDDNGNLEQENRRQGSLVRAVAAGNARRDTFDGGALKASVVYAPDEDSAFALLEGLPSLPAGKAYQAWFISGANAAPSNVFSTSTGGVWLESPGDVSGFGAIGLTIEDKDGVREPSQPPFLVLTLNQSAGAQNSLSMTEWLALATRD